SYARWTAAPLAKVESSSPSGLKVVAPCGGRHVAVSTAPARGVFAFVQFCQTGAGTRSARVWMTGPWTTVGGAVLSSTRTRKETETPDAAAAMTTRSKVSSNCFSGVSREGGAGLRSGVAAVAGPGGGGGVDGPAQPRR